MTTKAEWFRYQLERSRPHAPRPNPPEHREAEAPPARAAYALEACEGRPSRKSTRKSANRQKTDVQFRWKSRESQGRPRP